METCFSETSVSTYESTRRYNSEEHRHRNIVGLSLSLLARQTEIKPPLSLNHCIFIKQIYTNRKISFVTL
jgi:hypothetical protein